MCIRDSDSLVSTTGGLNGISLKINGGEKVGIVGRSGAGKSSLVNLILRFHELETGTISIDSQNIKTVTQNSLRENIGMVTQDSSLLHFHLICCI